MERTRRAQPDSGTALITTPEPDRRSPAVRRELSAPGIRAFFNVAREWELTTDEQRGLLGWPPPSTFFKYKSGVVGTLSYDMLVRISLVLGIYKSLRILYPEQALSAGWVKLPNKNPLFDGRRPLELMINDGIDGLYRVRRMLDARRGGWH
jgi:hypothetical protein